MQLKVSPALRAVGLGYRKLAVEFGQLLLGHRRAVGQEETGFRSIGFDGRFRFLNLDPQLVDLLGEPSGRLVVDAGPLLDLLSDVELGQPVGDRGGHARVDRCEHKRNDARACLLIDDELASEHLIDDFVDPPVTG